MRGGVPQTDEPVYYRKKGGNGSGWILAAAVKIRNGYERLMGMTDNIRVIASDFDGTILKDGAQHVDEEYFPLIRELKSMGISFIAASAGSMPIFAGCWRRWRTISVIFVRMVR